MVRKAEFEYTLFLVSAFVLSMEFTLSFGGSEQRAVLYVIHVGHTRCSSDLLFNVSGLLLCLLWSDVY